MQNFATPVVVITDWDGDGCRFVFGAHAAIECVGERLIYVLSKYPHGRVFLNATVSRMSLKLAKKPTMDMGCFVWEKMGLQLPLHFLEKLGNIT